MPVRSSVLASGLVSHGLRAIQECLFIIRGQRKGLFYPTLDGCGWQAGTRLRTRGAFLSARRHLGHPDGGVGSLAAPRRMERGGEGAEPARRLTGLMERFHFADVVQREDA